MSLGNCETNKMLNGTALPSDKLKSKKAVGTWDEAYSKATSALAKLSQSEKIGIITGIG